MSKILYICNGKKECAGSPSCGYDCFHTADPKYALLGECKDPENHPSRFAYDEDLDLYSEKIYVI